MKDERNVRQRRAAGRRWQPVAILLAAVLMVLSVPIGLTPAYAVDLGDCSLTVIPGNAMALEDLEKAGSCVKDTDKMEILRFFGKKAFPFAGECDIM